MTPSYIRWVMGKGGVTSWLSADYSSNQKLAVERKAVSIEPSLLGRGDVGMRKPHSLLVMYASAERGRPAIMISAEE